MRLVVVDNGSRPDALGRLRGCLPEAEVVELGHNAGFGPAANAGLRRWLGDGAATADWVAVAPHDALPAPDCLSHLVRTVSTRPRAGLASATFEEQGLPVVDPYFGGILVEGDRTTGWEDAGHPHGTLLFARRECLEDVGLFDERYFAYCEEADLGVRARRAGWAVGVVWEAKVANPHVSANVAVAEYLMLRNSLLLVREHFGRYRAFIRFCFALANTARLAVRPRGRSPFFCLPARRLAMTDFLRKRFGPPPERLWKTVK